MQVLGPLCIHDRIGNRSQPRLERRPAISARLDAHTRRLVELLVIETSGHCLQGRPRNPDDNPVTSGRIVAGRDLV